jgi:steroid 5-alpha reductase family enzyme
MQPLPYVRRQRRSAESGALRGHTVSHPLALAGLATALAFVLLWWRQTQTKDATSVDAAWAAAIGLLGVAFAAAGTGSPVQRLIAGGIAAIWSGRLCWHLLRHRIMSHRGEDGRYRAMREHWGERANQNLFWFYLAQAFAAVVFALPFWFLANWPDPALSVAQWIGLLLLGCAQLLESLSDRQLERHRGDATQRGRTCRAGLWRYSRHPNYFFEWLSWCSIALCASPAASWLAVIQPIVMFLLVRFVSGVPFTELQSLKSRGDDYRRYQRETNAFFPWWPRTEDRA